MEQNSAPEPIGVEHPLRDAAEPFDKRRRTNIPLGVVDDPTFDQHIPDGPHPERPERLLAARAAVIRSGISVVPVAPRQPTDEELERVHTPGYTRELRALAGREGYLDEDTYVSPGSIAAATAAAGGSLALVDALLSGKLQRGIALLRPPGHHARPDRAMGFCLLNNVAIAAAHANARGVERVLVLDWDVHHGNGTQEAFFADPRVLYVSLHQWPFYPGSGGADEVGRGEGTGYTLNVPLSAGANSADYDAAFERVIMPVVSDYAPELVLVSAGFDAHRRDPLANMRLEASSYAAMTRHLVRQAQATAGGRIALFLEGGYDLTGLEESLTASLGVLEVPEPETPLRAGEPELEADIERARHAAAQHWAGCR